MKVIKAEKIECHVVETESGEFNHYTRYGPHSWTIRMGESDEPVFGPEDEELEAAFQTFMTTTM